jgi:pyridoxal phosphate enzyme (YggS family)
MGLIERSISILQPVDSDLPLCYFIRLMMKDNLINLREEIREVCDRIGREPKDVALIGVTKYSTVDKVQEGILAGLTDIGENRVQDAREKFPQLGELSHRVRKHMIGHLQTNKVKHAVELFDMIQSVDSEKIALEIDKQAGRIGKTMDVLLQVNTAGEEQKSGISPEAAPDLAGYISGLENLRLQGLMTMAPLTEDETLIRKTFRDLRLLSETIGRQMSGQPRVQMKYLSMGMSDDYKIALEEGSNMIRIGRAIFK